MIKRKMTPATTQVIINVIFERLADVEFGNRSKFQYSNNEKKNTCVISCFSMSYIVYTLIDLVHEYSVAVY